MVFLDDGLTSGTARRATMDAGATKSIGDEGSGSQGKTAS
jgi:hypothetical protein